MVRRTSARVGIEVFVQFRCIIVFMSIRKIAQLGHPVLRQRAREVAPEELEGLSALLQDMLETMHEADGVGLAAPQIHEPVRVVLMEVEGNERYAGAEELELVVLINPVVTSLVEADESGNFADKDAIWVYEGCLSVPGLRGRVRRPRKVKVTALDPQGQPLEFVWEGFAAAVVQHEVDHLDGLLFVDRVETETLSFLTEYSRYVSDELQIVDGREKS